MKTKSVFKSWSANGAIIGAVTFAIRLIYKDYVDGDELDGLFDMLKNSWIDATGLFASLLALWRRVSATNFDKKVFSQSTTWFGIAKGVAVILVALGYDVDPDQVGTIAEHGFDTTTTAFTAVSTAMVVVGRIKAKKPLTIRKALPA